MPASLGLIGVGGEPGVRHDMLDFRGAPGGFTGQAPAPQSSLPSFQGTGQSQMPCFCLIGNGTALTTISAFVYTDDIEQMLDRNENE